ncbi:MAG TPA: hypothetical protein VIQ02_04325 [Jiangellaceae bacterium]
MISKRHVGAIVLVAALGVLGLASAGLAADPPGQGPCSHGNSGKECKPDPQPDHGAECAEHGPNEGGVNEDHCLGGTTGTSTTTGTTTGSTPTSVVSTSSTTTEGTTVGSLPSASTQPADAVPAAVAGVVLGEPAVPAVVAGGVLGKTKSASTPKAPSAPKVAAKVKGNIRVLPFTP